MSRSRRRPSAERPAAGGHDAHDQPAGRPRTAGRGQATLASLTIALVALTAVTTVGVVVADDALADADRAPEERRLAHALADRLVAADASYSHRANVLSADRVAALNASQVESLVPAVRGRAFAVRLDGRTLAKRGSPAGGTTVRRLVLVGEPRPAERTVSLGTAATLPRSGRLDVSIAPSGNTSVVGVRLNGRLVRYDAEGLDGTMTIRTSRRVAPTVRVETRNGTAGTATLTSYPLDTEPSTLEVVVDV
jgi:hypothetical protein